MSATQSIVPFANFSTKKLGSLNPTVATTSLHEGFLKYVTTLELTLSFVYYAFVFIAVVVGNALVIAAYKKNWRLRTTTNTFILGLATADLLVGFISIPLWLYVYSCPLLRHHTSCSSVRTLYNIRYIHRLRIDLPAHCYQLRKMHSHSLADKTPRDPHGSLPCNASTRVGRFRCRGGTLSNSA